MFNRWLAALVVAGFAFLAQAEVPVPALTSRVTDLTGTLSAPQKAALEERIAAFEAKKGSQLAVLMLATTKPEEIEQYSIRVAEAWKVGRKGIDDGVILIVAKEDRRLRIETGYGLEGVISDSVAQRVISETITPHFKTGDFHAGISAGVEQLIRLVEGEKLPPPKPGAKSSSAAPQGIDFMQWIVPGIIFVIVVGGILKAVLGRALGSAATGLAAGGVAWLVLGAGVAAIAAVVAFILAFVNAGRGFYGGGLGGGGGGFSSGGSSGWGGGGGGFGGGGASGRW